MIDVFEIEREIISDVSPYISFSSLIIREYGILDDVVGVIAKMMFYSHEDAVMFYAERSRIILANFISVFSCLAISEIEIPIEKYGLTKEQSMLICYCLAMGFGKFYPDAAQDMLKHLPEDYVPPDNCDIDISRSAHDALLQSAEKFEAIIRGSNQVNISRLNIKHKYLLKYI
jgi:hypothetical protein